MTDLSATTNPATAHVIAQFQVSTDRPTTASLGIALHHFTEPLMSSGRIGILDAHRATTILTKQIKDRLEREPSLETIGRLVTAPDRVATIDGRTAAEICGRAWDDVLATATERAGLACEGVVLFGSESVMNLAIIRGTQDPFPWWGTTAWTTRVEDWFEDYRFTPRLLSALHRRPERVDDSILADILHPWLDGGCMP